MDLEDLSFKECLLLGQRAESLCARRFRKLARRLSPGRRGLRRKLLALAEEEEEHGEEIARLDRKIAWPPTWKLDEYRIETVLKLHFPTLMGLEEVRVVDAPTVRWEVRAIEEESMRFYQVLRTLAPDETSVQVLRGLVRGEARHREVLG